VGGRPGAAGSRRAVTPNQDAGLPILVEYDYVDAADRRFDLIALVMNAESLRGGGSRIRRQMVCVCQGECDHLTRRWNGDLDRGWAEGELAKVKAEPGEYIEESYERWRLSGLPIWAALAAGMKPTLGSHRLIGRRANLP
jgi:hypothetical protein